MSTPYNCGPGGPADKAIQRRKPCTNCGEVHCPRPQPKGLPVERPVRVARPSPEGYGGVRVPMSGDGLGRTYTVREALQYYAAGGRGTDVAREALAALRGGRDGGP